MTDLLCQQSRSPELVPGGDPTVAQIAEILSETYKPEGVATWLYNRREELSSVHQRRSLYCAALALAEGFA